MLSDRSSAEKSWLGLLLVIVTHVPTTWAKFFIRASVLRWIYQLLKFDISQQSPSNCSRPNDRMCVPFSQSWSIFFSLGTGQFFRPGGEGVGEFWMQHDKIYLIPPSPLPPPPSPKTLWIFLWFPRSIFFSTPFGLCWRRLISPPFPPENHVILPKILHPPLPMAKS